MLRGRWSALAPLVAAIALVGGLATSPALPAGAASSWTQFYSGSPFFGGPQVTAAACAQPTGSVYGPLFAVQVQTSLSASTATPLTGSLTVYRNNAVITSTTSTSWLFGVAQGLGPVSGSVPLGDTYVYVLSDGNLHSLRLILSPNDLAPCKSATSSSLGQPYVIEAQPSASVSNGPWDGFGVSWLNGVPASKLGNLNNVTVYPWTSAIANSSSYSSSSDQATALANVDATQWQLDSQALQTMLPAYVRTPFALPLYVTGCNTSANPVTCSYNWNTVGMNDKVAELQLMQQLGIKVILRATPPPQAPSPLASITFGSAAWTRTQIDLLTYLVHTEGLTNIAYDGEISEANSITVPGSTTPNPTYSYANYRSAMKAVKNAIAASPYLKTVVALLGPTASNSSGTGQDGSYWVGSASQTWPSIFNTNGDYLGAYDWHWYVPSNSPLNPDPDGSLAISEMAGDSQLGTLQQVVNSLSAGGNVKPVFMTELGIRDPATASDGTIDNYGGTGITTNNYGLAMIDYGIQAADAGVSGPMAYCLDADVPSSTTNNCGMVSTLPNGSGSFNLEPWCYGWSMLTRGFPPGSQIYPLANPSMNPNIDVLVAKLPGTNQWSAMMVNLSSAPQQVQLQLPASAAPAALNSYSFSGTASSLQATSQPLKSEGQNTSGLTVSLPAQSAQLLSTLSI